MQQVKRFFVRILHGDLVIKILEASVVFLLSTFTTLFSFRSRWNPNNAWFFTNDHAADYLRALAIRESGFSQVLQYFGSPDSHAWFKTGSFIGYWENSLLWIVTRFSQSPILSTNLVLLFDLGVTSLAFYFFLRFLKVSRVWAAFGTVMLNLLPLNFYWMGQGNIVNNRVILVVAILLASLILNSSITSTVKNYLSKKLIWVVLVSAILATSMPYYIFFALLLIWSAFIVIFVIRRDSSAFFLLSVISITVILVVGVEYWSDIKHGFITSAFLSNVGNYYPREWLFTKQGGLAFTIFMPSVTGGYLIQRIYGKLYSVLTGGVQCAPATFDMHHSRLASIQCVDPGSKIFWGSSLTMLGSMLAIWILLGNFASSGTRTTLDKNKQKNRFAGKELLPQGPFVNLAVIWLIGVLLWIQGGISNALAVVANFYRNFDRASYIIAVSSIAIFILWMSQQKHKEKNRSKLLKIFVIFIILLESLTPEWLPDIPSNKPSDPKFSLNLLYADPISISTMGQFLEKSTSKNCYYLYTDTSAQIGQNPNPPRIMILMALESKTKWYYLNKSENNVNLISQKLTKAEPAQIRKLRKEGVCGLVSVGNSINSFTSNLNNVKEQNLHLKLEFTAGQIKYFSFV